MSNKNWKKKAAAKKNRPDSVFAEAWSNMNEDMAKVMPGFLARRLEGRKGKVWIMVTLTFVELVVLGAIGKFVYDWLVQ